MAIAIIERHSLSGIGEGWNDECYVSVKAVTERDMLNFQELAGDDTDNQKVFGLMKTLIKDHFVNGKGVDESGSSVDMTVDDIDELPITVSVKLFSQMTGQDSDPKGIAATTA